jgi:adenylate kinase family enzyme
MRISIIGHAGSGKSTLARKISEKLNIPHLHLDRFWFESGGAKLKSDDTKGLEKARAYIKEKVVNFIKQDSWVSDGWYSKVQPIISERADCIFFLDIPLYRRLFNHSQRMFKPERHKELTKWDEFRFFYEIVKRTFVKDPKMRQFARDHSDKVKLFRNYKEIEKYLNTIENKTRNN